MADALTSVLAIIALLAGRQWGWLWIDPLMGIVGSVVIALWSFRLLQDTSRVLLDAEVPAERRLQVKNTIESESHNRVIDLHVWRIGPRHLSAIISLVSTEPQPPGHYKALLANYPDITHVTVEVHRLPQSVQTATLAPG